MKQLILGNEAVARGLYEAGCSCVSSYPGTPSTEITEAVAKYPAQAGDAVLLSPACASFDAFANFEVRGDRFCEIVRGLTE